MTNDLKVYYFGFICYIASNLFASLSMRNYWVFFLSFLQHCELENFLKDLLKTAQLSIKFYYLCNKLFKKFAGDFAKKVITIPTSDLQ